MKRIASYILVLIAIFGSGFNLRADNLFIYPTPPDSMELLQNRCDYIVSRFWDRCKFNYALLHPEEFHKSFGDWLAVMPYASADTVHSSIESLTSRFEKKGPEMEAIAQMARNWLYDDTASFRSDELYLPFAEAAANNKKLKKEIRQAYAIDAQILRSTMPGKRVPGVDVEFVDGSKGTLDDIKSGSLLLFFDDPNDVYCVRPRVLLDTDQATRALVESGELTIVDIYAGDANAVWREHASKLPKSWTAVAMPKANEYFDFRIKPQLMYLNGNHVVKFKDMDLDALLNAFGNAHAYIKAQEKTTSSETENE